MFQITQKTHSTQIEGSTAAYNNKPIYLPPTIHTYGAQTLLRTLGPARAYSHEGTHSDDEFTLFGTMP